MKFYRTVGMMIGAIVGVGVFGLPYVFAQAGFALALTELILIGFLLTILQLMQAEVAIQTKGTHRLVGYVRTYLGSGWSWIAMITLAGGIWGAMLAYMIVGGKFLQLLGSPLFEGTEIFYSLLIALVASVMIYRGLRFASKIEMMVVAVLLFLFLYIVFASLPYIQPTSWMPISWAHGFTPYGVILFSLAGVGVVPELKDVLGRSAKAKLGQVVITGMVIIVSLYAIFSAAVVGVTGALTTEVAFDGLVASLGGVFRSIAAGLGTLTILSIYFMLGIELLNTLRFDFHLSHKIAWLMVVIVPMVAYLAGAREFISVVGFVGSVFAGTLGVFVALTYDRMKRGPICKEHHCLNFPSSLTWVLMLLFVGGLMYEIVSLL